MKDLAQVAYEAYCASAGWRSKYTGKDLPQWEDVDADTKQHWDAASQAVMAVTSGEDEAR
jgi:hypothetical protein